MRLSLLIHGGHPSWSGGASKNLSRGWASLNPSHVLWWLCYLTLWSSVFFSVSGVAAPPSWSAMPDTLKSSTNDREKGLATASFPWMEGESVGFLFIVLSKLCRGPQRRDAERQQQGAWRGWNPPAIRVSCLQQSQATACFKDPWIVLIIKLPLCSNGTFKWWQFKMNFLYFSFILTFSF